MYFLGDEPGLKALLDGFLARLSEDLQAQKFYSDVKALLLAGGYGRGEGGVFRVSESAAPVLYNDLEFYLVTRDAASQGPIEQWCSRQSHDGEEITGIEVEFKLLRESAFRSAEPSMFYYDLLARHRIVQSCDGFIESLPSNLSDPALIPAPEAIRLLFNRGSGLLFSLAALASNSSRVSDGFIERNHAKVKLALADAVLAFQGRYHFSCVERHSRLSNIGSPVPPDWPLLMRWHESGVAFKLNPRHIYPPLDALREAQETITSVWTRTFLWMESLRLRAPFQRVSEYENFHGRLYPSSGRLRNLALHWRDRFKRGSALPSPLDYPRGALQRALFCLLGADTAGAARHLARPPGSSFEELVSVYERWWRFYN